MNDHNDIVGPSSSPETGEITLALATAQAEYPLVAFDSANPHFRSRFASYAQCCDSLRGPLTKNGIALPDFRPGLVDGQWVLIGTLRHKSGQYIQGCAPLLMPKGDMQSFGSAVTYAKRTLLMALTGGFAGEPDDDGQSVQESEAKGSAAKAGGMSPNSMKALAYESGAKKAIAEAKTAEEAKKHLDTVRLRAKEKAVSVEMFRRIEAEFNRIWKREDE